MPRDLLANPPKPQPRDLLATEGASDAPQPWRVPILSDIGDTLSSVQRGAMQGMTFGFGDEINAGLGAIPTAVVGAAQGRGFDIGRAYNEGLEYTRGEDKKAAEVNPTAYTVGDVGGSLLTGGQLAKGGLTLMNAAKPTITSMAPRAAIEGAIYGAASGFGRADGDMDDRLKGAQGGAMWGGAGGLVLGAAAGKLAEMTGAALAPTVQSLTDEAGTLYKAAAGKGANLPQAASAQMAADMRGIASAEGILTPTGRINESYTKLAALIRSFDDYGQGALSVDQMQAVRRLITNALKSQDGDERRIAMQMLGRFHQYLDPVAPEIAQANAIYHRAMNAETLQTAIEVAEQKAGQYGRSLDATLRETFGDLDRQIIRGQIKGFSQEEIEAIQKVARGAPIENLLRVIGKAAPTGIVSFGAGAGVPFLIGSTFGGPQMGMAASLGAMGTGFLARQGANAMTNASAKDAVVRALVGRGGKPASQPLSLPQQEVLRAMIAAGGNEAARVPAGAY